MSASRTGQMRPDPVETMTAPYRGAEQEAVDMILDGIPEEGGNVSREVFEKIIRQSFQGGVVAALIDRRDV